MLTNRLTNVASSTHDLKSITKTCETNICTFSTIIPYQLMVLAAYLAQLIDTYCVYKVDTINDLGT